MYRLRGRLDAPTANVVNLAVEALAKPTPNPDGTRDLRTAARRRAEALGKLATMALDHQGDADQWWAPPGTSTAGSGDHPRASGEVLAPLYPRVAAAAGAATRRRAEGVGRLATMALGHRDPDQWWHRPHVIATVPDRDPGASCQWQASS